jgi:cytochrome aa3-600 menaquinol oxidase subunit 4
VDLHLHISLLEWVGGIIMAQQKTQNHKGFPWSHVFGFVLSLVLTFAALFIAYSPLSLATILTLIIALAIVQAILQLVMFMHMSEGEGVTQTISIAFSFFIAVVTVGGTVWIFFSM